MKRIILTIAAIAATMSAFAQNAAEYVTLRTDRPDGIYAVGDSVKVWADLAGMPEKELTMRVYKNGEYKSVSTETLTLKEGANLVFSGAYGEPCQYMINISDGKATRTGANNAGFVVAPETAEPGFDEPSDLLSFWNGEIKKMRKMKIKAVETPVEYKKKEIAVKEIEINCVGPAPVRGYMAYPADAEPKSLPIIIFLHAAGHTGSTSAKVGTAASLASKYHALAVDVNAHGFLNQQPEEYYKDLYEGSLKDYTSQGIESRNGYYFKWMFLRAERTVDYLVTNPLWDGKHIIVRGTSQGGMQSAFLAGIDSRITAAAVTVPAGLDQGASLKGRACSWPKTMSKFPEETRTVSPYFDPALLLKYSKAEFWCEIGLFDTTCPAMNVFAAMNQLKAPKTIITYQRSHNLDKSFRPAHKPVEKSEEEFIRNAASK